MFKKKPIRIHSYLGYGTKKRIRAIGRVLEVENVNFNSNTWLINTLWDIFKQFESDQVTHAQIALKFSNEHAIVTTTDTEGYYDIDQKLKTMGLPDSGWVPYMISFRGKQQHIIGDTIFKGEILVPSQNAEYGIISDIDDTILHTGVASVCKWRLIVNTFFKKFDKRLPLEGTVDFYRKLTIGKNALAMHPIFYISNSPWNLYGYLSAFLKKNKFPKGPILLRDFKTFFSKNSKLKMPHKQFEILKLLEIYPDLKFILIGDSGEKDADIYIKIALRYPDRILAIYVRNVHKGKEKDILQMIKGCKTTPILLFETSKELEEHAIRHCFVK